MLGDLDSYMQQQQKKMELNHQLTPYTKKKLKMVKIVKYKK